MKPVNRCAEHWGKMGRNNVVKQADQELVAATITKAIEDRWPHKQRLLATKAGVSPGALSDLKSPTKAPTEVTWVLRSVCRVLRIDPAQILLGNIVECDPKDIAGDDIVSVAQSLVGSKHEEVAKEVLLHFRKIDG